MKCLWYVISYFALTHIAGLFLGMYLERKITQLSMFKNCTEKWRVPIFTLKETEEAKDIWGLI